MSRYKAPTLPVVRRSAYADSDPEFQLLYIVCAEDVLVVAANASSIVWRAPVTSGSPLRRASRAAYLVREQIALSIQTMARAINPRAGVMHLNGRHWPDTLCGDYAPAKRSQSLEIVTCQDCLNQARKIIETKPLLGEMTA